MSRTPVSNTQPSPSARTIVCLANSREYSEFCVAGKEVIGLNDRIPLELAGKKLSSSLLFIRPDDLCITVDEGSRWLNKVRARFHYNETKYWLTVTDPVIEKEYIVKEIGEYPVSPKGAAYLTVSISEPYEGFCYKLVAGVISGS